MSLRARGRAGRHPTEEFVHLAVEEFPHAFGAGEPRPERAVRLRAQFDPSSAAEALVESASRIGIMVFMVLTPPATDSREQAKRDRRAPDRSCAIRPMHHHCEADL